MSDLKRGYVFAVFAYALWGLLPLYWKLLRPTGSVEILAHRFVWSFAMVAVVLAATRGFADLAPRLRGRRTVTLVVVAAVLIALNWGTYIFGVNTGRVVETALGYFLNPLVTVFMGVVVLRERLRRAQWFALGLGAAAVAVLTIDYGRPPWIALALGLSFAFYGLAKKRLGLPPAQGLFAESTVVLIPAMGFLVWLSFAGEGDFGAISLTHSLLLVGAGVATAAPLLFFAEAVNRLPMVALGMCQYIAPILQFVIGVAVYQEAMPPARWAGFGLVWIALTVFTVEAVRHARSVRRTARAVSVLPGGTQRHRDGSVRVEFGSQHLM